MRTIQYKDIKERLTLLGQEAHTIDGKKRKYAKWHFSPGTLNDGVDYASPEYLDPIIFFTKRPATNDAARRIAYLFELDIKWR
jgi:hypothetical protein